MNLLLPRCLLPFFVPAAAAWLEGLECRILAEGVPLTSAELADARLLGIEQPEKIRLLQVDRAPLPESRLLRAAGHAAGLLSERTAGMSARYGIFVRAQFWRDRRLVAHELVHTRQYERLGGVRPFLREYLRQCLTDGYPAAAFELEAIDRSNEICPWPSVT